ncbi:MAG: hypothetical protein NTW21_24560 [Verrucomicrobia bacterium]|nr:hypothetical protein [Verrucomicrobiota bacterium]
MHRALPLVLILGILIVFRTLGAAFPETMPNFQPLAALFFCGALLASGWRGFVIPLIAWVLSYPLPLLFLGNSPVADPLVFGTTLAAFAVTFVIGNSLATRSLPTLLVGSVTAALGFHLITNGAAWLCDPRYAKTLAGCCQALWLGAPGDLIPTWVFLRNFAAANLLFTGIFLSARICLPALAVAPATASATR